MRSQSYELSRNLLGSDKAAKRPRLDYARSGKWTPEEERFANQLVVEFERGALIDCSNGCTLRSFLARKLKCAPMRISKKFAKKQIGKLVFAQSAEIVDRDECVKNLNSLEEQYMASCSTKEKNQAKRVFRARSESSSDSDFSSDLEEDEPAPLPPTNYSKFWGTADWMRSSNSSTGSSPNSAASHMQSIEQDANSTDTTCTGESNLTYFDDEAEEWKQVLSYFCPEEPEPLLMPLYIPSSTSSTRF